MGKADRVEEDLLIGEVMVVVVEVEVVEEVGRRVEAEDEGGKRDEEEGEGRREEEMSLIVFLSFWWTESTASWAVVRPDDTCSATWHK